MFLRDRWQRDKQGIYYERSEIMSNGKSFIDVDSVTKHYKDPASEINFQAIRGIDLKLEQGSLSAIIGPSGAGKSTLLNILGGMTKPSTGSVYVDDLPLHNLDTDGLDYYRRMVCGFVWQLPQKNLLPSISALENVMYAMEVANLSFEPRKQRAEQLLNDVGLGARMGHKLGQLSGGEAQRASLAVALANNPKLLLADEPTGELDSQTTIEVIQYLKDINQNYGVTIVVVTHDNRFERMVDKSYNIVDGVISGLRRSVGGKDGDWTTAVREEISVVNQFGMVKIPSSIREKYKLLNLIRFVEDEASGKVYLEPAE